VIDLSSPEKHVAFAGRLSQWLLNAGVLDPEARATLAVGLSDFLAAAKHAEADLEAMLACDPSIPEQADRALTLTGQLAAWLFTEAKEHAIEMEAVWEEPFMTALDALGLPDPDDPSAPGSAAS
jgi:hypothetical protein